jgi:glycosyltransferase involved in cell wall biosynthesis
MMKMPNHLMVMNNGPSWAHYGAPRTPDTMRIALIHDDADTTYPTALELMARLPDHLAARGHTAWAWTGCPATELVPAAGESEPTPVRSPTSAIKGLASFGPDLVHLVEPGVLALPILRQARSLGASVVASCHAGHPNDHSFPVKDVWREEEWLGYRWWHDRVDLFLSPAHLTPEELAAHGLSRARSWRQGVDTVRFSPAHRSSPWRLRLSGGCPEAPLVLVVDGLDADQQVGRLQPLLHALAGVRLAVVGDGPQRLALQELFAGTATVFAGVLAEEDLARALASADALILPTNCTDERTLLAALASGLPVVAPAGSLAAAHVAHFWNGALYRPDDPADLVVRTRQVIGHPATRCRLGDAARELAEACSWETVLDELLVAYAALCRPRTRARRRLDSVETGRAYALQLPRYQDA